MSAHFGRTFVVAVTAGLGLLPGCGLQINDGAFDPDALAEAAQAGNGLSGEAMFDAIQNALAERYPSRIARTDAASRDWVLNSDEGVPGQVAVLYQSPWEYLVFVGTPTSADWSIGPSTASDLADCRVIGGFAVTDFVLAGEVSAFGEGEFEAALYGPGDRIELGQCTGRSYRIADGAWMLEYGSGNYPSSLYSDAFFPRSTVAQFLIGLPGSILNEYIRNVVTDALGAGSAFGGF